MVAKLEEKKNALLQELVDIDAQIEALEDKKEHINTKVEVIDELIKEEAVEVLNTPVQTI